MAKKSTSSAAPQLDEATCRIRVRVFDGRRQPLAAARKYIVRILDGNQQQVFQVTKKGPEQAFNVPAYDSLRDQYTVIVSADGCADAGFYPVPVKGGTVVTQDVMVVEKPSGFDLSDADWDVIQQSAPSARKVLAQDAATPAAARARYDALLATAPVAAALWNILTSMRDTILPQGTVLDYLRAIIWDGDDAPAQDRFFCYADRTLIDQVIMAVQHGTFAQEPNPSLFHPDATRSWKQVTFGEANLQLTFHEKAPARIENGETWVKLEPDIDYYKDLGAHALLEILPNALTSGKTDPRTVYILRWIAGRRAQIPEFNPPYCLVALDA